MWDADFRMADTGWSYNHFSGNKWQKVNSDECRLYLKKAYRVLFTRAWRGMVVFIPDGFRHRSHPSENAL